MQPPRYVNWDDRVFVIVGRSDDTERLDRLVQRLGERIWGIAWLDHLDDVCRISGQVGVLEREWDRILPVVQTDLLGYAAGYLDD